MPQNPPVLVSGAYGSQQANTTNQYSFDTRQSRGEWFQEYGGAWYQVFLQFGNSTAFSLRVSKSTDSGATWTVQDQSNEPQPNTLSTANRIAPVVMGGKFYICLDHEENGGGGKTYEVRFYTFDCATETWAAGYVAGKSGTSSYYTTGYCFISACSRGTDELLVMYNYPVFTGGGLAPNEESTYIDIYNTTSASWTTTDIAVFDGSGGWHKQDGDNLIWDGTYVHIFSGISNDTTAGYQRQKLHVTLSASNTIGTYQNILSALDPSWPDPVLYYGDPYWLEYGDGYQWTVDLKVHNGKVYAAQSANISAHADDGISGFYWWLNRCNIICFECNAGSAVPTFTCRAVLYDAVDVATNPKLVKSGASLHCVYVRDTISYPDPGRLNYSTLGGSGWSGDIEFYNWTNNPPGGSILPGYMAWPAVRGAAGVPLASASPNFGIIATLNYNYWESVWFLSNTSTCCCANYAY